MKEIKEQYEPVERHFLNELQGYATQRTFIRLHYFSDLHEYISTTGIISRIQDRPEGEYLLLNTGEEVRLDKIVRYDGKRAPGYDISDFTCDC